jgi:hypothetical protein
MMTNRAGASASRTNSPPQPAIATDIATAPRPAAKF